MATRKPQPIDFDLTVLLAAAGTNGMSLPALTILARDVTGNLALTEKDVRAQLTTLLARGVVATADGRWRLK